MKPQEILQRLPGDLVLRRASPADSEKLAAFNTIIHSDTDKPDDRVGAWTADLLSGNHPTVQPQDFTIVEEAATGRIVSSLVLISQQWSFAGLPIRVGRPELVGTHPDFRRRGLVRKQFEVIHEWSRQRGELLQAITGIPNYYRQFDYEMTVNLGGGRMGMVFNVPKLEKDAAEPFTFRPARESDVAFIANLSRSGSRRSFLSALRDDTLMHYEIFGRSPLNVERRDFRIIETPSGEPVGYLAHPFFPWNELFAMVDYELKAGVSWYEVTPAVIRYLWQTGEELAKKENKTLQGFGFWLIENHPAFQVAAERVPIVRRRYAWYMRVPDLPAFLSQITPVLEQRLAESNLPGYSGEVKLGFYQSGLLLKFAQGKLTGIESWQPATKNFGKATYPGSTFLHLLFGYRTQEELESLFPDCFCADDLRPVMRALFPKQPSDIWPID
jgi:hypothetical protein